MALGALIAGGVSLLSGLFGRNSAKKQARKEEDAIRKANDVATAQAEQMNAQIRARADAAALVPVATERETVTQGGVDMAAFMKAAEENGFNPLTFLRSGALSLFANNTTNDWTCTTGERAMDAALSGTYLPQLQPVIGQTKVPGVGEIFGNALTSGANQYLSDLSQQQNNDFQMKILERQLAGAQQRGAYGGSRSMFVPQAFQSGSTTKRQGPQPAFLQVFDNRQGSPTFGTKIWVPDSEIMGDPEGLLFDPMFQLAGKKNEPPTTALDQWEKAAADQAVAWAKQAYQNWFGSGPPVFIDPDGKEHTAW